ncbi:RNA-guided endonuclease TnpB family protein [Natronorubrum tibetense]|uniref:Transposase, IS605 OrfB family protein n=1 Tax=Natronorubrum tibetense GA33 TaxID=1114856 RepID=L9VZN5_9EURY|nr:RNA-guided endonuclease TnpB family protein [Natronorubrum tibetense]ELY42719.1 transposase, IS605 OrfB family protein [Natronorubrum tibetense GA33]
MTTTATKTLEATLAPPTKGKEQRLERTVATYRRALSEAFESDADTQTAVNDIVTPYTLTSYAKDALKNYVPKLRDTYNASEIKDDHPVRFTNRGFRIDHSDDRTYEFCWRVPQAGRGNAFWIPLRINPEQESLWFDLFDESATVGEFRLQQHRTNWVLNVTVEYNVAEPEIPDDPTRIGFDIGESKLLTGCARQNDTPTQPYIYDGGRARALRKEMYTTLKRLQERDAAEWRVDERFDHYQNALTDIVEKASHEAVEYAESFDNPVIVLEDLSYIRGNLDYGKYMNRRLHAWTFARFTDRIEDKALDAGIPVEFVNPRYTSQTCHACGHIGSRGSQAEFKCTNSKCWITEYQADINAAANIAGRVDPWGESVPWKPERDDSPRNGSRCDTAAGHRTPSRQSRQTTLAAFES